MRAFLLTLMMAFVGALTSASVNAAIEVYDFSSSAQEQQYKDLVHTLRCPKCQNNSIGDSNAQLAQDLRQKVYEMTMAGHSKQEIVDYMVQRYGNFVTYRPPFMASTAILWFGPLLVVLVGFGIILGRSRRKRSEETPEVWSEEKESQLKALLDNNNQGDK